MAQFNPPVQPTNDPNYEGRSRPIDIPETIRPRGVEDNRILPKGQEIGDRSAEYEGKAAAFNSEAEAAGNKGFGDLFAGIVGIGDFMAKAGVQMVRKDIEDRVYEVADAERQRYTAELENIKAGGGTKSLLDSNAQMTEDLPDELSELPETLGVLKGAESAGKLSRTGYQARLLAAAKDLRARYPGFKNEIDKEFSKVTGMNPANSYISGLVNDINRMQAGNNTQTNKLLGFILSRSGFDGADDMYNKVQSGQAGANEVIKWAAPIERLQTNLALRKAMFDDDKQSKSLKEENGIKLIDTAADAIVQTHVSSFLRREMGITSQADAEAVDVRSKNGEIPAQEWSRIGQKWATEQLQMRQAMLADARSNGLIGSLGLAKVNERIDAAMANAQGVYERIYNRDSGGVFKTSQWIKALGDEDQKNILTDSEMGPYMRNLETQKRVGGEGWVQKENLRQLIEGINLKYGVYVDNMRKGIQAQADLNPDGTGNPLTVNRVLNDFKVKLKDASANDKRLITNDLFNELSRIGDPSVPEAIRVNLAYAAFHPEERSFISRLNPDNGGQEAVFQKLTTPEITKQMAALGKKHPKVWENYVAWSQETLGKELVKKEFLKLGEIRNPAIKVGWDSDNKRFVPTYNREVIPMEVRGQRYGATTGGLGGYNRAENDPEYGIVMTAINRINSSLNNFKHVAEASGGNVEAFMLGSIVAVAGPESLSKVDSIPGHIIRQIGLTQLKKKGNAQ